MVCVREEGSPSDPARGEILAVRDGEWLMAKGSTLGADNGIAIAAMMHLAEAPGEVHGPLDLVFTVLEETTSGGADMLDPSLIRSKVMLNLDSEDEGVLVVGSAGCIWSVVRWSAPLEALPDGWSALEVALRGAQGGHSGTDIGKQRLNAVQGLARLLEKAAADDPFSISALKGGDAPNAIPREARAILSVPEKAIERFRKALAGAQDDLTREFSAIEPELTMRMHAPGRSPSSGFKPADSRRLVDMLTVIPCGVLAMDRRFPGLVATSSNMGVLSTDGATVSVESFSRSSTMPTLHEVVDRIRAAARLGDAEFAVVPPEGPAWELDSESRALAAAQATYRRLFGADLRLLAVHGFLECALIKKQIPGLDIVSIGPEIRDAHKPGERVHVGSVERFFRFLSELVSDFASPAWQHG
jgi:dipeptidase D